MINKKHLLSLSSLIFVIPLIGCNPTVEHTVTFDCTDIKEEIPSQKVKNNEKVTKPDITITPKLETKIFDNYYLGDEVFDFNAPITKDITITVKVIDNIHTVTFDCSDIKETIEDQKILHKNKVDKSKVLDNPTPKETTKKFVGYYVDGKQYNFDDEVTKDLTIKCLVEDNYHTVTFDANGGTLPEGSETVNVLNGKTLIETLPEGRLPIPTPPDPNTQYFVNWLDENAQVFNPSTKITSDRTLKASYTSNWITVTTTNRNIDSYTGNSSLTAMINGKDVTNECAFEVVTVIKI